LLPISKVAEKFDILWFPLLSVTVPHWSVYPMEWCVDIVLDPISEQDSRDSRHTRYRADSGFCHLLTDSNVEAKVDKLVLSAHKGTL
jgi:hypothetical protein